MPFHNPKSDPLPRWASVTSGSVFILENSCAGENNHDRKPYCEIKAGHKNKKQDSLRAHHCLVGHFPPQRPLAASVLKQASAAVGRQMPVDGVGRMDLDWLAPHGGGVAARLPRAARIPASITSCAHLSFRMALPNCPSVVNLRVLASALPLVHSSQRRNNRRTAWLTLRYKKKIPRRWIK